LGLLVLGGGLGLYLGASLVRPRFRRLGGGDSDGDGDGSVADQMIGLREGESRFVVDPLHQRWQRDQGVPREDGRPWPPGQVGEGGAYEREWRNDYEESQRLLEEHPDYVFLTLVAGHANMLVKHLFDEDALQASLLALAEQRQRQQVEAEEVRASTRDAAQQARDARADLGAAERRLGDMRTARAAADPVIVVLTQDSVAYQREAREFLRVQRQAAIAGAYTAGVARSEDTLRPVRKQLEAAMRAELDAMGDIGREDPRWLFQQRLIDATARKLGAVSWLTADILLELWLWQSDRVAYLETVMRAKVLERDESKNAAELFVRQVRESSAQRLAVSASTSQTASTQRLAALETTLLLSSFRAALVYMSNAG
ncbi:hypothetical protein LCGC14_2970560, partial [marine sediment metagenome]